MEKNIKEVHIAECHNCGHTSKDEFKTLLEDGCTLCKSHAIVFVGSEEIKDD